jgi:hypothetical protein
MKRLIWGLFGVVLAGSGAIAAPVSGQGTWETTLQARDADGNVATIEAYYDTVLNITWLANANLAASTTFGVAGISTSPPSGSGETGRMTWDTAQVYIAAMNSNAYLGETSWRLPHVVDINNDGCLTSFGFTPGSDCGYNVVDTGPNASEMASMFYRTLGNLAFFDTSGFSPVPGYGLSNTGPFSNLQDALYWYDQTHVTNTTQAWYFGMPSGGQRPRARVSASIIAQGPVWAVISGDHFAVVPVPAAAWLLGSALGALGWLRRKPAAV